MKPNRLLVLLAAAMFAAGTYAVGQSIPADLYRHESPAWADSSGPRSRTSPGDTSADTARQPRANERQPNR